MIQVDHVDGVALVRMNAGRGNAMGRAFLTSLREAALSVRAGAAVVIGSGRVFSAGLDLPELVALDRPAMRDAIELLESTMEAIYTLEVPVVAAINGAAIAGGCVLALNCDRRVIAQGARIGLTEAALGIGLPPTALEPLREAVPASSLAPIALEGGLFEAERALALGLVDEIAGSDVEARAIALAAALAANGSAYAQIKRALRAPALARMRAAREREIEAWLDTWFSPLGRARLEAQVEKLTAQRRERER
jgi:enoyl-CoA hydratase